MLTEQSPQLIPPNRVGKKKATPTRGVAKGGGQGTRTDDVSALSGKGLRKPAIEVGTETGTVGDGTPTTDGQIAELMAAWSRLPAATQRKMLEMLRAAGDPQEEAKGG